MLKGHIVVSDIVNDRIVANKERERMKTGKKCKNY